MSELQYSLLPSRGLSLDLLSWRIAQASPDQIFSESVSEIRQSFGGSVLNLIWAILALILGWIVASIVAATTERLLKRTRLDNRLADWVSGGERTQPPPIEKWIATAVFWVIMLFFVMAFFQVLELTAVISPINRLLEQVVGFLPKVLAAALLIGVAWVLATISKMLLKRSLKLYRLDERLGQGMTGTTAAGESSTPSKASSEGSEPSTLTLSETLANTIYWFIFLLFLPSVLSTLELEGTLQPVQELLNEILSILPDVAAALLLAGAGWLIAQVVRRLVTNVLSATGMDQIGSRFGISQERGGRALSWIIGTIVYVLVLIPVAIAALNALQVRAISEPAISMLTEILNTLPQIFTAGVILTLTYVLGQFVKDLITNILTGLGFNQIFVWLGLQSAPSPPSEVESSSALVNTENSSEAANQTKTPSELAGIITLVGMMLFATVAAVNVLGIDALTEIMQGVLLISGQVLTGLVVFAIGLYFGTLSFNLISSSGYKQALLLAHAARIAILILTGAMALQQIGIAPNIVNLTFGLLLGSIAIAFAIAFGLGSREIAAEQLKRWLDSLDREES
jgi:hypothetical protein